MEANATLTQPVGAPGATNNNPAAATSSLNNIAGYRMSGISLLKVFLFFVAVQVVAIWVASKVVK